MMDIIRCSADKCCSSCEIDALRDFPFPSILSAGMNHATRDRVITVEATPEAIEVLRVFHRHEAPLRHRHEVVWANRCEIARVIAEKAKAEYEKTCAEARVWLDAHP